MTFAGVYSGRRVFVTGHTGFKGSWLTLWLLQLGAHVTGYALDPPTEPSLFDVLGLGRTDAAQAGGGRLVDVRADVRDGTALAAAVRDADPEIVLHLAAQPLVRRSYAEPHLTFETNVMGSVDLFQAVRAQVAAGRPPRAVVNVTSDKCYLNRETGRAYAEDDPLGGHDPYSASKACAELVTASYRRSYFERPGTPLVASARAGNVVGGGDWGADRILPDCARALSAGRVVEVRHPAAVRPWQHVLESLSGYLWLAARMWQVGARESESSGGRDAAASAERSELARAWNFGPSPAATIRVSDVVDLFVREWGSGGWRPAPDAAQQPHEAGLLALDAGRAERELGWSAVWSVAEAVSRAARWYREQATGASVEALRKRCLADIGEYELAAGLRGSSWAGEDERT